MNFFILKLITMVHLLFVIFVVVAPMTNSNYLMMLHSAFLPFLIVHWIFNDSTCAITMAERYLRKKLYGHDYEDDECITCRIVEPVYDFRNNYEQHTKIIYSITMILWAVSFSRLCCKYSEGNISSWQDLFKM